jgi:hypothetical protein
MAPRTPRYQPLNLQLRVPSIDFAGQKQAIQSQREITNSMERMSRFMFNLSEGFARVAGAEYGASKIPTGQQLNDMISEGESLDVPGDKFTVFGQSARKAALDILVDELSMEGKKAITNIALRGEVNRSAPQVVADNIDTAITGLASILDEQEPALARKFRASMGVYGNAEYSNYTKARIAENKIERKAQWEATWQLSKANIPTVLSTPIAELEPANQFENKGLSPVSTKQILETNKQALLESALRAGFSKAEISSFSLDWNNSIQKAATDMVYNYVNTSDKPKEVFNKIKKGQDLPPEIETMVTILTGENKKNVIAVARQAVSDARQDKQDKENQEQAATKAEVEGLKSALGKAFYKQSLTDQPFSTEEMKDIFKNIERLYELDADEADKLRASVLAIKTMSYEFATLSNEVVLTKFSEDVLLTSPKETIGNLDAAFARKELTPEDFLTLRTAYTAKANKQFQDVLKLAASSLDIPTGMFANTEVISRQSKQIFNKFSHALMKAYLEWDEEAQGTLFDAEKFYDENFDKIQKSVKPSSAAAALKSIKQSGLTETSLVNIMSQEPNDVTKADKRRVRKLVLNVEIIGDSNEETIQAELSGGNKESLFRPETLEQAKYFIEALDKPEPESKFGWFGLPGFFDNFLINSIGN